MDAAAQIDEIAVRVKQLRWECEDHLKVTLQPVSGSLPEPEPGAHVDVILPNGLTRQYSLTLGSSADSYVIGVLREAASRGGSSYVHERLRPGDLLRISQPRNTFRLDDGQAPAFLIAGGIGMTPLLSMADALARCGRQWSMLACVRWRQRLPFADELDGLGIRIHADDEDGVPDIDALVADIPPDTHLYCCGPGPMLDAFVEATASRDPSLVHLERFELPKPKAGDGEILVELARSGQTVVVPADKSILDTLIEAGINAPCSCKVGVCGTCETRLLDGEADHRDLILTDEERAEGRMLICCSRARTQTLVLDM